MSQRLQEPGQGSEGAAQVSFFSEECFSSPCHSGEVWRRQVAQPSPGVPGYLLFGVFADRYGRRRRLVIYLLAALSSALLPETRGTEIT